MKRIRIAVVGCGGVAHRWYLPGLQQATDAHELTAVVDRERGRAEDAARRYGVPWSGTDLRDCLDRADMIVDLTNHSDHYDVVRGALEHGRHVYAEKPFAPSFAHARELIALARSKGVVLGAAPQVTLSSRNRVAKEIIDRGTLGKITLVRASGSNMGPADRPGIDFDPEWFYQDGGSLHSLGIYTLSTLVWLLGPPQAVFAQEGISIPERTVMYGPVQGKRFRVTAPDHVVALLTYPEAAYVLFDGSYSVRTPPKHELEIHGTEASLFVGGFGGPESVVLQERGKEGVTVGPDDRCHIDWTLAWGAGRTARLAHEGALEDPSAEHAALTILVMDRMKLSAESGRMVPL